MSAPWQYRLGFLGSWTLAIIAAGVAGLAVAAEVANLRDAVRIRAWTGSTGCSGRASSGRGRRDLKGEASEREGHVGELHSQLASVTLDLDKPLRLDAQTILISTAENRLWVRRGRETVFQAVVSTGKGTTLEIDGRKMTFDTPTGRFKIRSEGGEPGLGAARLALRRGGAKEEARPRARQARRRHRRGDGPAPSRRPEAASGRSWTEGEKAPRRVLKVKKDSIVEVQPDGSEREIEPGSSSAPERPSSCRRSDSKQRRIEKTLGRYRLNLGDGYALHGTQATSQLGRSVSHGCVRLADDDLQKLYEMAKVGDEVIIY